MLATPLFAQEAPPARLSLLDVPYVSQTEALCGGAAAAMVLRYWGERGISAESFEPLVDRSAAGIRTDTLIQDLRRRGWQATGIEGRDDIVRRELAEGRPILALIEDRPGTYHYVVIVAWHERGVIFHDPARAPFRVTTPAEFQQRWGAADRWMAVVLPPAASSVARSDVPPPVTGTALDGCEATLAEGIRAAQAGQLDVAERILTSALACPGGAVRRELAGVRLLQRRWPDVADLAVAALEDQPGDPQALRLLATARFVQNDRRGALEAWNRVGEPRLDLLSVAGLDRTRFDAVERLISVRAGDVIDPARLVRARRQLDALPAAAATSLEYVPVGGGLAELRAAIVERPLLPSRTPALAALGLRALASREVRLTTGSISGGGESLSAGWLFGPGRQRVSVGVRAPAPWGGTWGVEAARARQSFTSQLPEAVRVSTRIVTSDWATGRLWWSGAAGLDRWRDREGVFGSEVATRWLSYDGRVDVRGGIESWLTGVENGSRAAASAAVVSSAVRRGVVVQIGGAIEMASPGVPAELWPAGDTGHARATLLRAHPVLDSGALRTERLGRLVSSATGEVQRWWTRRGVAIAAAAFVDVARTDRRLVSPSVRNDVDAGVGVRFAVPFVPGVFRVDVGRGLADGAPALSFVHQP